MHFQIGNTKELADCLFAINVDKIVFLGDLEYHGAIMSSLQDATGHKLAWWLEADRPDSLGSGSFVLEYDENKPPLPWIMTHIFTLLDNELVDGTLLEVKKHG